MRLDVVTIFPEFFDGPLHCGVLRRALEERLLEVHCHGLRQFTVGPSPGAVCPLEAEGTSGGQNEWWDNRKID